MPADQDTRRRSIASSQGRRVDGFKVPRDLAEVMKLAMDNEKEKALEAEREKAEREAKEAEQVKAKLLRLGQLERMNAELAGKMQRMQLRHEAETAELRQDLIAVRQVSEQLKYTVKQREEKIAEQEQVIYELKTGISMTRVQLAYNFVARFSNIDVIVDPEDIFTTLEETMSKSPLAYLTLPGQQKQKSSHSQASKAFSSPSQGGIKLVVEKQTNPREWRRTKLKICQLLSGMGNKGLHQGEVIESKGPTDDLAVLEFVTPTQKEAKVRLGHLEAQVSWGEGGKGMLEGINIPCHSISLREASKKKLTPAGEELLRSKLELYDTENRLDCTRDTPESRWEKALREQHERNVRFQESRTCPPTSFLPLFNEVCPA